ncbi:EF-hand calcium-binding domain-containing protein 10 [Esox lucius]|uniref:EFCAB10 C-terminal EF-hand domain-containing protein n=1 Tax=Esox lucius TaxID=8010 RepID=A0AAY5L8Z1_ESOLU|nr:EF-hand calcium-binding domain-containing protein 10 [Esox lucius]
MATPREQEAADFLRKHKIIELMDNLTSMLLFHRPGRPREFLITQLEQLRLSKMRSLGCPSLFNDTNLDAVFGILDPIKQGHITYVQYKEALTTLGIEKFNECPEGMEKDKISQETFRREANEGLQRSSATFMS